jgi:Flp pilus assembly protein TadG
MNNQKGNASIEFAVSGSLILGILMLSFKFGYSFYTYNRLEGGVAAGARYASRLTYDSTTSTPSATFREQVTNMVVYGSPAGGTRPLVTGLKPENVLVSMVLQNGVPKVARVSIVNFDLSTSQSTRLNGKPFAEFRYMGRYAP